MKMFLGGEWREGKKQTEVTNPFDNSVIDTVPVADEKDVGIALAGVAEGAAIMKTIPAWKRFEILRKSAELIEARSADLAATICKEEGKTIGEATFEVSRAVLTMLGSAEEAKRLYGESLPMDAGPGGEGRLGFTLRVPCGVVVAISPFNFPLNLVCHKVGPALAAGNAVVLKPASDTPLTALKLVEILLDAGLPPSAIACVTGPGGALGKALCSDKRVRKISFTGSAPVGEKICQVAGMKKVTMELGSNCPLVIMDDADLDKVADQTVATGYSNAGQVCISTQRVLAAKSIYGDFLDALKPRVEKLASSMGDPLSTDTRMGPMIREKDAAWVEGIIKEATGQGARLLTGGGREANRMQPAVIADVNRGMRIFQEELFAPAVTVSSFSDINEAIALANDSDFGLGAGIFTQNIDRAMKFAMEVDSGNIHINWGPQWRADFMPYGGLKMSGMGKEGPKYAIEEMTELKMVVIHVQD